MPKEKNLLVHEGQVVNRVELIVDCEADPQDILRLLGSVVPRDDPRADRGRR